ncbi:MAG TPA: DUF1553 domain-containing protein, partial [Chitinophagaceae bacterium]|nr:DUF1553 domain-containing protein [Chitinophagaceae bacterium]
VPPPALLVFDASNRDQCEVVRSKTSTPLQALVMLNDPQVLEASRVLAEKFVADKRSDKEKLGDIFRLIVCRRPDSKELTLLENYLVKERQEFARNPQRAAGFITAGEFRKNEILDKTETAAFMQLIHTIYNLDESGNKY